MNIRVEGLDQRLKLVESQVTTLQDGVKGLTFKFETVTALMTIENLITRTRTSMDTGYDSGVDCGVDWNSDFVDY